MEDSIIQCPGCGTQNRTRTSAGKVPVCGNCKKPLPWITTATDVSFEQEINSAVPVLVDFWAEWCAPCRMVSPILEELARDKAGEIKITKVNVDLNPNTASRFRVLSIPTMIVFKDGRPVDTFVGAMSKKALISRLAPYM